ncbi:MAG: helicase-related protein, partial [Rhodanobacteraceae bacterium]
MGNDQLPIAALLPAIRETLNTHTRLVLEAPPGAGKTTGVPPALLDCEWLGGRRILMLEPRRLAARAAAGFMARQRGEAVGQSIGFRIRFENRVSDATRIEVVTEGIFTRMLQADPGLDGVGAVLFDEFHERHLAADLGIAMARDVQAELRPDLRLVLMSATLDGERLAAWLGAPQLCSEGRSHPVDIRYPPARAREAPLAQLARLLPQVIRENDGDVLVFLPGQREIHRAQRMLAGRIDDPDVSVLPLHGSLPLAQQRAVLEAAEPGTRHVILATNVAESSVTLPGIRSVIDLGLAREPRFDPRSGLTRLE